VERVQGDVRVAAFLDQALDGVGYVIHAAGLTDPRPRPYRQAFRVNVEGTRQVCAAAVRARVRRLVYTSSASTIAPGTAATPATEESPPSARPGNSPYYRSKQLAEQVVREQRRHGLDTVSLLPAYILGPRDARPTTNQLLLFAARAPFALWPGGGINIIDVRTAALAHVRALWLGEPGARYLVAGPYQRYAELGRLVRQLTGQPERGRVLPAWTGPVGVVALAVAQAVLPQLPQSLSWPSFQNGFREYHLSGARGDRTFGLVHRPVRETIADALAWFRDAGREGGFPLARK
jgi:dihydroflavonol-4-reductase